jgi:hypothetical protein
MKRDALSQARLYMSSGVKPVTFATLANIFGPISSVSWKAKTTSGQPGRSRILCEPVFRLTLQPIRDKAVSKRLALTVFQPLTPTQM